VFHIIVVLFFRAEKRDIMLIKVGNKEVCELF